jgi:phytoene dehydrogenase-like protein
MASGTAFMFLHQHVGVERGIIRPTLRVRGGIGQVSGALADAATRSGAEIRVGVEVDGISTEGKRVTGVTTAGGEHIQAQLVVSGLDPRRTFLGLLDPTALDVAFRRKVANLKFRGVCAKVNLALSELPDFTCVGADQSLLAGLITISPSLMYLERAYDAAKYGRVPSPTIRWPRGGHTSCPSWPSTPPTTWQREAGMTPGGKRWATWSCARWLLMHRIWKRRSDTVRC